ncbi:patatin family protein [Alkalicoccus luteus]|uniref:patatin-like phospholipase family protein n=1 Tax=Alkalicoccus luteus TaxID=1237094 RepID=UPI0031B56E6F
MNQTGLVLEGGGMRGVFTSGVLEYLLESNIQLPFVVGVSAGACNAASYISGQHGRNREVTIGYADHPEYISFKRLLRQGELFNMDLIFDTIPNIEQPFHYQQFFSSPQQFYVGVTDCITGETIYYEKSDAGRNFNLLLRASSSLPMVAKPVPFEGRMLMDGGISDPIPLKKSLDAGNKKHIIVLTQSAGYRKQPAKRGMWYFRRKYKGFPGLIQIVENRYRCYNDQLDQVQQLELEGKAFVIRPEDLSSVTRTDRNKERLEKLYRHGYDLMYRREQELKQFLEK